MASESAKIVNGFSAKGICPSNLSAVPNEAFGQYDDVIYMMNYISRRRLESLTLYKGLECRMSRHRYLC